MSKWGMVIDLDKCTACQACIIACQAENNVPFAEPNEAVKRRTIHWMELIPYIEEGEHPNIKIFEGHYAIDIITEHHVLENLQPAFNICFGAYIYSEQDKERLMLTRLTIC